jgi:LacI family transcriptional regulator
MTFGLAVMNITNPFFSEVTLGVEEVADENGYAVIVGNSYDSLAKEAGYLHLFERQRCDGILLAPVGGELDRLQWLRQRPTPVVLVDRQDSPSGFRSVSVDDFQGGLLAGRHLLEIGCHRIAFVGGPFDVPQMRERRDGCAEAVREANGTSFEVVQTETLNAEVGRVIGDRLASLPPDRRPDGIFAANDVLGLGLLQSLLRHGVRVPEDVAIVGYDDIDFAAAAIVPLTSISQPTREIGRAAGHLLLAQLTGVGSMEDVRYEPDLVVRESTRRRP